MTYAAPIFVRAQFQNANTGEIKEQTVFMGDFPVMTDRGTFIINGTERVVVSQLVRSPGVIFQPGRDLKTIVTGTVHPYRGEWIEFDVEAKPGKDISAGSRVARKRRLSLFTLLRALGYADEAFLERFVRHFEFLEPQWDRERELAPNQEDALLEIYKRARPGEPPSVESARAYFENAFFNPKRYDLTRVGRYKLDRKLGPEIIKIESLFGIELDRPVPGQTVLSKSEVLAASTYLLHLAQGEAGYRLDDQDHFANRRVRSVGELIQNQVRVGLSRMERVVRERMTTQDVEAITPQTLINIRPVVAAIKEFFGTSQLSQFMDQTNPLSGLTHKRRLSAMGPGGLSRERAGFEVRDVHSSHYGRMCPIETPEGPNIGLIGHLATYGRINEYGFIETPYRRVTDGTVTDRDRLPRRGRGGGVRHRPGQRQTGARRDPDRPARAGEARPSRPWRTRRRRRHYLRHDQRGRLRAPVGSRPDGRVPQADRLDLDGPDPLHRARRRQPGAHGRQHAEAGGAARPPRGALRRYRRRGPGRPGHRRRPVGRRQRHRGRSFRRARDQSSTSEGQSDRWGRPLGRKVYPVYKFRRSNQNTCFNQRIVVDEGQPVGLGDVLADGPSTEGGELGLGKNLLVAFMPWEGYNYEDAIILSERLVKDDVLSSIHIEEHEVDARDTKLGAEEITRDIPNLSEEILKDLDERGIIRIGAEVGAGDVLVGKVTPKGETELTPEERLLRAIFGEKAREVRDTSLKVPHGESGKVIDVRVFSREDAHELPPGVNQLVRVYVAQKRKITEGDKLAGRHGNKGVISKILPVEDMPHLADGTPVDMILNPLGVPSRMNVGQVLESHLGWAARWGWDMDGKGRAPSSSRRARPAPWPGRPAIVATPSFDGAHWDEEDQAGKHPTIKKIFENLHPEAPGTEYGDHGRLIGPDGKAELYNGRTGEPYDNPVSVGYIYILKLAHLVDDKIHARSTGPYSMITQQPLGGKAQFGGQRFGEMEVWALEAYGAAYALQELLTIKSDDVLGRVKVYEAIVKGDNIPEPGIPESFKVLIKEMQSLCLNVEVLSTTGEQIEMRDLDEDVFRTAEELGIDISRPERGSDEEDARRASERSF